MFSASGNEDAKLIILENLSLKDLAAFSKSARHWSALIADPVVWRRLLRRDFNEFVDVTNNPKQRYKDLVEKYRAEVKRVSNFQITQLRPTLNFRVAGLGMDLNTGISQNYLDEIKAYLAGVNHETFALPLPPYGLLDPLMKVLVDQNAYLMVRSLISQLSEEQKHNFVISAGNYLFEKCCVSGALEIAQSFVACGVNPYYFMANQDVVPKDWTSLDYLLILIRQAPLTISIPQCINFKNVLFNLIGDDIQKVLDESPPYYQPCPTRRNFAEGLLRNLPNAQTLAMNGQLASARELLASIVNYHVAPRPGLTR